LAAVFRAERPRVWFCCSEEGLAVAVAQQFRFHGRHVAGALGIAHLHRPLLQVRQADVLLQVFRRLRHGLQLLVCFKNWLIRSGFNVSAVCMGTCIRSQIARQSTSIFSIVLHWNQVAFQVHLALDNSAALV
jgi:hypothetical protein